jgi:hypothetical protein
LDKSSFLFGLNIWTLLARFSQSFVALVTVLSLVKFEELDNECGWIKQKEKIVCKKNGKVNLLPRDIVTLEAITGKKSFSFANG